MSRIKRYFGTGVLITLPIFFTLYLFFIIIRFVDNVWGKLINAYLRHEYGFTIPGIGIVLSVVTVLAIGFVATNFLGKRILHLFEFWFLRLPFVRLVYPAAKQIVGSLVSKESQAFKKVVMVEYPSKGIWSVGFLTGDSFPEAEAAAGEALLHIFIATSPSPLTGFLILMPKKDVRVLTITVEEGMKLIVSGGIVLPA